MLHLRGFGDVLCVVRSHLCNRSQRVLVWCEGDCWWSTRRLHHELYWCCSWRIPTRLSNHWTQDSAAAETWTIHFSIKIAICHHARWRRGVVATSLVSINEVNLRWARLVLRWVTVSGFDSRKRHFISVCNQPPRSTQPSTLRGTVNWVPAKGRWCSARLGNKGRHGVITTMRYTNRRILYFAYTYNTSSTAAAEL